MICRFDALPIGDQTTLLRDPRQPQRRELANRVALSIGEQPALRRQVLGRKAISGAAHFWQLAEPAAQHLCDTRKKLDKWWDSESLTYNERKHLIQHRGDDGPPARVVMVESVPAAYLEIKAH